jgi:hypothetical protein
MATSRRQLVLEALDVRRFEKTWADDPVHFDRTGEDGSS